MGAAGAELTPAPHFMQNFWSSAPGSPHCGQNLMAVPSQLAATGTALLPLCLLTRHLLPQNCPGFLIHFRLCPTGRMSRLPVSLRESFGPGSRTGAADDSALVQVKMLTSLIGRHRVHIEHKAGGVAGGIEPTGLVRIAIS